MQRGFPLIRKRKGERAERDSAKRLGLQLTPGSGSRAWKGDARDERYLQEHKSTSARSIKLDLGWLCKLVAEARASNGREPLLSITFTHPDERAVRSGRWVMVREDHFMELVRGSRG